MEGCSLFTTVVYFVWRLSLLGRIFARTVQMLLTHQLGAIRQHMAEEGQNLRRMFGESIPPHDAATQAMLANTAQRSAPTDGDTRRH